MPVGIREELLVKLVTSVSDNQIYFEGMCTYTWTEQKYNCFIWLKKATDEDDCSWHRHFSSTRGTHTSTEIESKEYLQFYPEKQWKGSLIHNDT